MTAVEYSGSFSYTDGWHPTVNPSSRMPVYYHRHISIVRENIGILNEVPRKGGGCTLRFIRFSGTGIPTLPSSDAVRANLFELPSFLAYVPWWMPSHLAWQFLHPVFDNGVRSGSGLTASERNAVAMQYDCLRTNLSESGNTTLGEVVNMSNFDLSRYVFCSLPDVHLRSLTKAPERFVIARVLDSYARTIESVLARMAIADHASEYTKLAFGHSEDLSIYRVAWAAGSGTFCQIVIDPLSGRAGPVKSTNLHDIAEGLVSGTTVVGARLIAIVEAVLSCLGARVTHFGNTYGRIGLALSALEDLGFALRTREPVHCLPDGQDSWNYAFVASSPPCPLHLLDLLSLGTVALAQVEQLVQESLRVGEPLYLAPHGSLDDTVSSPRLVS